MILRRDIAFEPVYTAWSVGIHALIAYHFYQYTVLGSTPSASTISG
jgi:hypothetical protein